MPDPRCPRHDALFEVSPGVWICLARSCKHRVETPVEREHWDLPGYSEVTP